MEQELNERLSRLEGTVQEHVKSGNEWRNSICSKFDTVFDKLDEGMRIFRQLPCKGIQSDVKWLTWGVRLLWAVIIVGGLIRGVYALGLGQ